MTGSALVGASAGDFTTGSARVGASAGPGTPASSSDPPQAEQNAAFSDEASPQLGQDGVGATTRLSSIEAVDRLGLVGEVAEDIDEAGHLEYVAVLVAEAQQLELAITL